MKTKQLDKQLAIYSTAAGAVLLGASGAKAAIIYTPLDVTMDQGNPSFGIDFDGAGGNEAQFGLSLFTSISTFPTTTTTTSTLPGSTILFSSQNGWVNALNGAAVAYGSSAAGSAWNFSNGSPISGGLSWENGNEIFRAYSGSFSMGMFDSGTPGYIGFRFDPAGGTAWNYGWIHIDSLAGDAHSYHIAGYAYDDSGASIPAGAIPEPSSLALLALGAAGAVILRREQKRKAKDLKE